MRLALLISLLLAAFPALADTSVEQLHGQIVTDTVGAGFTEAQAQAIATCFTSRMTEAEAEAVLADSELEAQQQALAQMADYDQALACTVETLG
ncbi:hypothetical protein [Gymnodinialimonas sp.]